MSTPDPNAPTPPKHEPELWLATLDTRNFIFTALGLTRAAAIDSLEEGWKAHRREYIDADPNLMKQAALDGEINVQPIRVGDCLRDGTLLHFTPNN